MACPFSPSAPSRFRVPPPRSLQRSQGRLAGVAGLAFTARCSRPPDLLSFLHPDLLLSLRHNRSSPLALLGSGVSSCVIVSSYVFFSVFYSLLPPLLYLVSLASVYVFQMFYRGFTTFVPWCSLLIPTRQCVPPVLFPLVSRRPCHPLLPLCSRRRASSPCIPA